MTAECITGLGAAGEVAVVGGGGARILGLGVTTESVLTIPLSGGADVDVAGPMTGTETLLAVTWALTLGGSKKKGGVGGREQPI